ncbi:hypothetical protein [Henriciella litoralis]|uniref:hypothetical protein n=1 Tax=Henriciella litoralis TaxID=568102 RepID=UPI000A06BD28|nr:hypothetical protein [Henriciella litoralis]
MLKLLKTMFAAGLLAVSASSAMAETRTVKTVVGDLPGEAEFEALQGIGELADGDVVLLDLRMLPLAWPVVSDAEGNVSTPQTCAFGMIEGVEKVSVPTGSNHLLMTVWLGDRVHHAANGLSCEYVGAALDAPQMRLTGCYLAREISIPTARSLNLNPLPASACGLYD